MKFPRKHTVEDLGGSRLRFTCKTCGHTSTRKQLIGPRGMQKPYNPQLLAQMVRYWNANGGATMSCLHCERLARE
jgi:hypothetical protein